MKLIDVLKKMKVGDLKKEISKQNIKGYSKLKKAEIIKIMIDRPDKFKYLLLQNMEQKKEILEDKIKLKKEKEKLQKLTAKKIPTKKAQQAEVIKSKPKREPMIPKIIKTKTGVVTVKPKAAPKPAPKPAPKKDKDELKLINLEKELKQLVKYKTNTRFGTSKKGLDELQKTNKKIIELKFDVDELKKKIARDLEDKVKENQKKNIKIMKKIVEDFLKNPNEDLYEKITEDDDDVVQYLPIGLLTKMDKAISKYEAKDKKTEEPKKEKLKDCPAENHKLKFTKDYKDFLKQSRIVHPDKNKGCVELAKKMFQQLQIHYSKYKNPTLREIANIVKNFEYTVKEREDGKVIIELDKKSSKSIKRNELQDLRNKLKQLNPNYRIMQKL